MVLGLSIVSLTTILLSEGLHLWRMIGIDLGIAEILAFLILVSGIGIGIALPASNNACIELMPEKVATITGLRGMFRTVGGALGISLVTVILHSASNLGNGFRITFVSFGLGLLFAMPLVFLMPAGKTEVR
jgi:xanthine/uracil/vitamin C permease (AzgA family)